MKVPISAVAVLYLHFFTFTLSAQVSTPSSSTIQGLTVGQVLNLAITTLASNSLPNDIQIQGSMQITSGGRSETAAITAAALGVSQSYEAISGPNTQSKVVYTHGAASLNGVTASVEFASSAQSGLFPAQLLCGLASTPNGSGTIIGIENVNGASLLHFQTFQNFPDVPNNGLAPFTQRDWWIDPSTGLVKRLAFDRRSAGGATPAVHYEYTYLSYQSQNGLLTPTKISLTVNGTQYATILITSIQVNTGLTSASFQVQ